MFNKNILAWLIISAVLFIIIILVLRQFEFINVEVMFNSVSIYSIASILFMILMVNILMILRWYLVAWILKIDYEIKVLFLVFPISTLSAMALVGPLGGDYIRYKIMKHTTGIQHDELFLTIIVDRFFSLVGIVGAVILFTSIYAVKSNNIEIMLIMFYLFLGVLFAGGGLFILIRVISKERYDKYEFFEWARFTQKTYIVPFFRRINYSYIYKLALLFFSYSLISIFAGVVVGITAILIAGGNGSIIDNSVAAVVGNLASSIPLTPGGIGFGEAGFQTTLNGLGASAGDATPYFVFRMGNIFVNLFFTLLFIPLLSLNLYKLFKIKKDLNDV